MTFFYSKEEQRYLNITLTYLAGFQSLLAMRAQEVRRCNLLLSRRHTLSGATRLRSR